MKDTYFCSTSMWLVGGWREISTIFVTRGRMNVLLNELYGTLVGAITYISYLGADKCIVGNGRLHVY
jgi:hypothetical protein